MYVRVYVAKVSSNSVNVYVCALYMSLIASLLISSVDYSIFAKLDVSTLILLCSLNLFVKRTYLALFTSNIYIEKYSFQVNLMNS